MKILRNKRVGFHSPFFIIDIKVTKVKFNRFSGCEILKYDLIENI